MISGALLRKWTKMLKHESVFHAEQKEGSVYSISELKGYYNDLTAKVLYTKTLDEKGIPYNIAAHGEEQKPIYFPITVFQYGLGAYDLFLENAEEENRRRMLQMAAWALENQAQNGAWDAFGPLHYACGVSSMAQGEGASLLTRAYAETEDIRYLEAAKRAVEFMLLSRQEGGTADYTGGGLLLYEYPEKGIVLNGWIFSAFGLLDLWKASGDGRYLKAWRQAVQAIKAALPHFDAPHWSYYDLDGKYASPFYHNLHIELLKALDRLEPDDVFKLYISKWCRYRDSSFWRKAAFLVKAKQKLLEKKSSEWILAG